MSKVPAIHPMRDVSNRCFLLGALSAKCAMTGAEIKEHKPWAVSMAVVTFWVYEDGSSRRDSSMSFRIGTRKPYRSFSIVTSQQASISATG